MIVEKFSTILKKERHNELIPFLKSLNKEERKELAPSIKKLAKEYLEFTAETSLIGHTSYKQKATPQQTEIILAAAFVCLNRKEYQKLDQFSNILNKSNLDEILIWYCPDWFSDSVNEISKRDWLPWHFKYDMVMKLAEKGYLKPDDELIVRLIPDMIFERNKDHKYIYVPQNLVKREITLQKHIWLLFQYETSIHFSDRYMQFQNAGQIAEHRWLHAIKDLTEIKKLDRQRLLKESILATSRNFNKTLTGWFIDLFNFLQPSQKELLTIQTELLNALNSKHSRAINTVISSLKKIVEEPDLNIKGLLENLPLILSSETKSVVSSSLLLLEKILRKHSIFTEEICVAICQAFIHDDEVIQSKVSKLLLKYHKENLQSISNEINKYKESMLMSSKKSLVEFLLDEKSEAESALTGYAHRIASFKPLPEIKSIDELIFLASQAFDNNSPFHIDQLPAALISMQEQFLGSIVAKFEPALQRAYQFVMNDWPSTMGYLDHLLATFFIDFTRLLIAKFPIDGTSLKQIHDAFKRKNDENMTKWPSWYKNRILELKTWTVHSKDTTYVLHKSILVNAYEKLRIGEQLPLLSTPTHECGYLDPLVFIKRLSLHQAKDILPDNYDFQIAISRIAPFNHEQGLREAKATLKGEVLRIIEFLLRKEAEPVPPFTTPSLWFIAGITKSSENKYPAFKDLPYSNIPKSIFTGDVPWKSFTEHFKIKQYNYKKNIYEEIPSQRHVLRLTLNAAISLENKDQTESGILSKLTSWLSPPIIKSKRDDTFLIYEFLSLKAQFLSAEHNDIERFISLFPSNPNPLFTLVISKALTHSTFSSETDKRLVTKTLETLVPLKFQFSEISHLFVATCMLTSDKTVRSFAAEMWINAIKTGVVNSTLIGKQIGIHLSARYAPMKRFTDLVSSNLLGISKAHNTQLELLLSTILHKLSDPLVGVKRLLELYSETLSINSSYLNADQLKQKLIAWQSSDSLKKKLFSRCCQMQTEAN